MGKIVPLEGTTLDWARGRFARYYRGHRIDPPPRFARREFAAFPFARETAMRRHAAFPTAEEFRSFLEEVVPRHVYYSSAYYARPDHPSMASKEWLGADLIFDLDADHLRGSEGLGYARQLELVKEQLKRLYDDFLLGDFGVDPAKAPIVFSGGRGYHVHVRDERFLGLTSPERRELVDYVMGTEFDPSLAIYEVREPDDTGRLRTFRRLAPPDTPGWRGRTTRGVQELFIRWAKEGPAVAAAELERAGVAPKDATRLARQLVTDGGGEKVRETLRLDGFKREIPTELLRVVLRSAAVEVQGETDAPVTTDLHRLIRLPESLHGGTGFRVARLSRDALDGFDPFRDAVEPDGAGESVSVELSDPVDHPFDGGLRGAAGERLSLPPSQALFLVLRGEAALRPSPAP
jgi:DNA primase small subunit